MAYHRPRRPETEDRKVSHRHRWLYVNKLGKPLPVWKRRCACGAEQTWRAKEIREWRRDKYGLKGDAP